MSHAEEGGWQESGAGSRLLSCLLVSAGLVLSLCAAAAVAAAAEAEEAWAALVPFQDNQLVEGGGQLGCPSLLKHLVPGALAGLILTGITIASHRQATAADSDAGAARVLELVGIFSSTFHFAVVIPDSHQLSRAIGMGPAFSGCVVGMNPAGCAAGAALMWSFLRCRPLLWLERAQSICCLSLAADLLGALLYTWVAHTAAVSEERSPFAATRFLPALLLLARFVAGCGLGVLIQQINQVLVHLTPEERRPEVSLRYFMVCAAAIGMAPLAAAAVSPSSSEITEGQPCPFGTASVQRFTPVGLLQTVLTGSTLFLMWALHPNLERLRLELPDKELGSPTSPETKRGEQRWRQRRRLIFGCLALDMIRAYGVAGVEVTTALLLETIYGWSLRHVGLALGVTVCFIVPAFQLSLMVQSCVSAVTRIRVLSSVMLVGSLLLQQGAARFLPSFAGPGSSLLVADLLLLPSLYVAGSLGVGLMQQHLLPMGSRLDANHTSFFRLLAGQGFGRLAGPTLGRWTVDQGGQDTYAEVQFCVCVLFISVFELLVRPNVEH